MTARPSMSEDTLGRRAETRRDKAKLSPWTLSGIASALADCPRTARREAARGSRAKTLHLELEVLLRGQRWRHQDPSTLVVLPLLVRTTPGVHHLIFGTKDFMSKDIAEINSDGYDIFLQERLRHDKVDRIEWTVLPPTI